MGKHAKDLNKVPFDPTLDPGKKGQEFDEQYEQNRKDTPSPNLDNQRRRRGDK